MLLREWLMKTKTGQQRWMQHDVRQKSYFVHKFSRATLITGKAGPTMLSNKTPTASPNTLKVIMPTSDRFTTSTEWSITTMKNACPTSYRSLMMSTTMLQTLSSTAWAKDPRRSRRKYVHCCEIDCIRLSCSKKLLYFRRKIWPQGGKKPPKLSRQFLLRRSVSRYIYHMRRRVGN